MTKEDRAVAIVDLIAQTMAAINDGERAEHLLCHTLGRASDADALVLLSQDHAHQIRTHILWPNPRRATPLAEAITASRGHPLAEGHLFGELRQFGPPLDAGSNQSDTTRLLVISRRAGFTPEARIFFSEVTPTLGLLLPRAAAACQRLERARMATDAANSLNLTSRELEVLQLLSEGLLARTIAQRLGLSPRTIHKHLSNVYGKLGVHDRLVAVSYARERGLINP